MKFGKRDKSIVDALFLLALFGVFLICALFIVLFGAKIYKNVVNESDLSFIQRTSSSYITEKMRQNDNDEDVAVLDSGDGSVLRLAKDIEGNIYYTYLYCEDGYLREYTNADPEFNHSYGSDVLEMKKMDISRKSRSLFEFNLTDVNDRDIRFFVSKQAGKEESDE